MKKAEESVECYISIKREMKKDLRFVAVVFFCGGEWIKVMNG
jgi:hypothetical protein